MRSGVLDEAFAVTGGVKGLFSDAYSMAVGASKDPPALGSRSSTPLGHAPDSWWRNGYLAGEENGEVEGEEFGVGIASGYENGGGSGEGEMERSASPWKDSPKKKRTGVVDETAGWALTKEVGGLYLFHKFLRADLGIVLLP